MTTSYFETLTKCKKCGKYYLSRNEQKKCPHNFKDKFTRQLAGQEVSNDCNVERS